MYSLYKFLGLLFIFLFFGISFSYSQFLIHSSDNAPEFFINFQNPTYLLEKDIESSYYMCDSSRDVCKINLNFVQDSGKNLSSTLNCRVSISKDLSTIQDFRLLFNEKNSLSGEHTENTIERCNPLTQTIQEGLFLFEIQVEKTINPELTSQRFFLIDNNSNLSIDLTNQLITSIENFGKPKVADIIPEGIIHQPLPVTIISNEVQIQPLISSEAIVAELQEDLIITEESTLEQHGEGNNTGELLLEDTLIDKNSVYSKLPNFNILLQRPSYVERASEGKFDCDKLKPECKFNIKLVDDSGDDISSTFSCTIETDFDIGTSSNACNPNTIIIPKDTIKDLNITLFEKAYPWNALTKIYKIDNSAPSHGEVDTGIITTPLSTKETISNSNTLQGEEIEKVFTEENSKITNQEDNNTLIVETSSFLPLPQFRLLLQQPSYVQKVGNNLYECDESKNECKMNIKLTDEDGDDISSRFSCTISTSFDIGVSKSSCNPNTIIIPKNKKVNFEITLFQKDFPGNAIVKNFIISNIIPDILPTEVIDSEVEFSALTEVTSTIEPSIEDNTQAIQEEKTTITISNADSPASKITENPISQEGEVQQTAEKETLPSTIIQLGQETNSGALLESDKESKDIIQKQIFILPKMTILLQQPSYVKISHDGAYICNIEQDECKINFKLTDQDGEDFSSNIGCNIITNFNIGTHSNLCNPTTLTLPKNTTQNIIFQIYEKVNPENFAQTEISIQNIFPENPDTHKSLISQEPENLNTQNSNINDDSSKDVEQTYTTEEKNDNVSPETSTLIASTSSLPLDTTVDTNNISPSTSQGNENIHSNQSQNSTQNIIPKLDISQPKILLQQPSYVYTNTPDIYHCDNAKETCKVNLKLLNPDNSDIASGVSCNLSGSFDLGENSLTCNPGTFIIPQGSHTLSITLSQKNLPSHIVEKTLIIHNNKAVLESPEDTGIITTSTVNVSEDTKTSVQSHIEHTLPSTGVYVQGKLGKRKKLGHNNIICYTYSTCSLNFTSGKLYASEREGIRFRWSFGNGDRYSDYNPKSIKYAPGKYNVKLSVSDDFGNHKTHIFRVDVIQILTKTQQKKVTNTLSDFNNYEDIIIEKIQDYSDDTGVTKLIGKTLNNLIPKDLQLGNIFQESIILESKNTKHITSKKLSTKKKEISTGTDKKKSSANKESTDLEKALKKNINLRVTFQKKSLKIYGKTASNSSIKIFIGEKIYNTSSDVSGKYVLHINNPPQGNHIITAEAYSVGGQLVAKKSSRDKEITNEYIASLAKYIKSPQASPLATNGKKQGKKTTTSQKNSTNQHSDSLKKLKKNITLRVSKQKKNLKLSGKTFANSKVTFTIGKQKLYTFSNSSGKYTFKTHNIYPGNYIITAQVFNKSGGLIAQKSSAQKVFDIAYVSKMQSYYTKKVGTKSSLVSKAKEYTAKIKKISLEDITRDYTMSNAGVPGFDLKLFLLNFIMLIGSILLGFKLLIKNSII